MQLELLYSFFIVCLGRHKKIQVTNTQIYVCFFFLYSMKKNGSDWHKHGHPRVKNNNGGWLVAFFFNTISEPPCVLSPKVFIWKFQTK